MTLRQFLDRVGKRYYRAIASYQVEKAVHGPSIFTPTAEVVAVVGIVVPVQYAVLPLTQVALHEVCKVPPLFLARPVKEVPKAEQVAEVLALLVR